MKASKPTSTALGRILALPIVAGLLAGCDYASRLPEAPSTLGYELQAQKPPSVTAPRVDLIGPPPPSGPEAASPPALSADLTPPRIGEGLDTQALRVSGDIQAPRAALALPPTSILPAPPSAGFPDAETARLVTENQPYAGGVSSPVSNDFPVADYQAPALAPMLESDAQFGEYQPVPFDSGGGAMLADAPAMVETRPIAIASLPADLASQPPLYDATSYEPPAYDAPLLPLGVSSAQDTTIATTSVSSQLPQMSPISVLHTRLDNGAVVNVHPVVGAPGATSVALARTIASELGAQVDLSALAFAPAVFDLRASASRSGDRAEAEWKLFSGAGALVGVFPEMQSGGTWSSMTDDTVRAMGRRVADRLRRNADLRRATLTSVASAPPITSIDYSTVLPGGAPSLAPMPRPRPVRMAQGVAPIQPAPLQPAPLQYVVNTAPLLAADPMANAVPRRRPEGVRIAALKPMISQPGTPAPLPVQPVVPAPVPIVTRAPAPVPLAPLGSVLPTAPLAAPAIPAPSFDTLRAAVDQVPEGPRALVFRGVRGAPGNGDQALGREVSRLLGESGAQLAPNGTPNALYLTADVSRTRNGGSDSIKIMWHVEEADGTRVGQVVQENDVPAGALDANWGEDAFYAAQGARDGIIKLLRTTGALDA